MVRSFVPVHTPESPPKSPVQVFPVLAKVKTSQPDVLGVVRVHWLPGVTPPKTVDPWIVELALAGELALVAVTPTLNAAAIIAMQIPNLAAHPRAARFCISASSMADDLPAPKKA
jgi:hypothetical protein